jgi:hypothetical protein
MTTPTDSFGAAGGLGADRIGRDNDPMDRNGRRSMLGGGQVMLPAGYADFIMEDGRRLEDVLGKSFFPGFGKKGLLGRGQKARERDKARARILAERRAQARRLNHKKAILTGSQGVAGPANTSSTKLSGV